jgi:hypothetical protein
MPRASIDALPLCDRNSPDSWLATSTVLPMLSRNSPARRARSLLAVCAANPAYSSTVSSASMPNTFISVST